MEGNNQIDSYEFLCGTALISQCSLLEKAELVFSFHDFDANKYITRDELVIMLLNCLTSLQ